LQKPHELFPVNKYNKKLKKHRALLASKSSSSDKKVLLAFSLSLSSCLKGRHNSFPIGMNIKSKHMPPKQRMRVENAEFLEVKILLQLRRNQLFLMLLSNPLFPNLYCLPHPYLVLDIFGGTPG